MDNKNTNLQPKQNFIEQTLRDIFGWSEARSTCGYSEVFVEEFQNLNKLIDQEIQKEDPSGKKREKFESMGDYPENEWDEIINTRIVALLSLKDYADHVMRFIKSDPEIKDMLSQKFLPGGAR